MGVALRYGTPQNFGVPRNISETAEPSDFKFGALLGLPRTIIKLHAEEKVVAVTDSRAVDALLLVSDCIVHQLEIGAVFSFRRLHL